MVAFVEAPIDGPTRPDESSSQVQGWADLFQDSTYEDIATISKTRVGNDFMGWTSMYDGKEINKVEMQEWLDDTIQTVLDGQEPGHVLEIGTGSGMVLFNLGQGLKSYVGLEPSRSAAAFVSDVVQSTPTLAGKVEVHVGTATDVGTLDGLHPNLVVINSVAQYFPTPEYLVEVVEALTQLPGVQRLFFGDIRSFALNRTFLASRAIRILGEQATRDEVRRKMSEIGEQEEELLVDPAFFTGLMKRLPDRVKHVEILPKKMRATNELSSYRYAAVVHLFDLSEQSEEQTLPVHSIASDAWIDFNISQMDRHALIDLLHSSKDVLAVAISNIPYRKTALEQHVIQFLDDYNNDNTDSDTGARANLNDSVGSQDGTTWISDIRRKTQYGRSLSATELVQVGEEAGFRVEISWARQRSQNGALDAVFHRFQQPDKGGRVLIQFPTEDQGLLVDSLMNRPLQRLQSRLLEGGIRAALRAMLPSYMVPTRIVVLDRLPVNPSGKVDRKALANMAQVIPRSNPTSVHVAPRNDLEAALCEEFANVLGVEVGVTDNFFHLGGHSLMATKLATRISRRLDVRMSVKDVFDYPVITELAATVSQGSEVHRPIPQMEYSGPVDLSYAQGRLWFLEQLALGSSWYVMPLATRLKGPLEIDALTAAVHALEQRHETLRTTFEERDGPLSRG
ncbi:protein of unknown function DUF4009 [Penicillium griseofulvum]|uniref:Carrier domain-containing protein n=1 Tax=Penicillium patulum TaxID=5078 RepID=A0A135M0J0_PENPA|nr:protein of unknown function DUF4009 [Penicillium griseofulvum]KXG54736.1 protein of unknown function DUF4009 [Penicillium griseofulvum]